MTSLRYCLIVTGPAYGTQQSASAYLFANELLAQGHQLSTVFFYREGVHNGNRLTSPSNDEFDQIKAWQRLAEKSQCQLHICVAAALRRGIIDQEQGNELELPYANLADNFELSGLGSLAEAILINDRVVQF